MKKIISSLLALIILLSTLPTMSFAAMGDFGGNITGATWYWPLHGFSSTSSAYSKISSSYGYRGNSYKRFHYGVDIGASVGTTVYPARKGTVCLVKDDLSYGQGRTVFINHADGYYSVYMHLSKIYVSQGQVVDINTPIAASGASGFGYESYYDPHLHFGIHYGSSYSYNCNVNPCPSGYTRIGDSLQENAGGYPVGSASISYSVNPNIETPTDTESPTISNVYASNLSGGSFNVNCTLNDNIGVTRVWLNVYGPGGSKGYEVSASNGIFSHTINTSEYGGAGIYSVHIYVFDSAGNSVASTLSDINAVSDIESPVISNLHTTNVNSSSFTINCNLSDNVGVTRVWLNIYGPGGSKGYEVSASNGIFSHTINTSEYGGRGTYTVHVYAFDAAGNSISSALNDINAVTDSQAPVITLIRPTNVSSSSFTINGTMYDNVGVTRVWLNIYGPNGSNGYSVDTSNNTFSHTINTSDYGGSGYYSIHVYAWDNEGNSTSGTLSDFYVGNDYSAPIITNLNISGVSDSAFTINCSANEKINRAWVYIIGPNKAEGYAVHMYGDSFMHTIETSKYGGAGSYEVHVYVWDAAGNESSGLSTGKFIANKQYTVNFNANLGMTPLSSMIVTNSSTYGTLPLPHRVGYTFVGWFTSSNGGDQISSNSIVQLSSSQTLYAQWKPNNYVVFLDANGGNVDKESINITYDSTYGDLPTPTKSGYYFNGWYTTQDGDSLVTNYTKVTTTSNQTLYAKWEKLIPYIDSIVTKNGSNYLVTIDLINIDDSCEVMIAGYKDDVLVTFKHIPYEFEEINTTISKDIDEIKVMAWDSPSGLTSLCDAEVIPSSEFIAE